MIYAMSDIHGRLDLFEEMLKKIEFSKDDTLIICGDSVDCGGGLSIIKKVKEMLDEGYDIVHLTGNHELILLNSLVDYIPEGRVIKDMRELKELSKGIDASSESNNDNPLQELLSVGKKILEGINILKRQAELQEEMLRAVKALPGYTAMESYYTFTDLQNMSENEISEIIDMIYNFPYSHIIELNGKTYIFVHGGCKMDSTNREVLFIRDEFYMNPSEFPEGTVVVFGHTTTRDIRIHKYNSVNIPYTIWHDESGDKIGLDCGASYPYGQLGCLRLDDMKEFYVKNNRKIITPVNYINDAYRNLLEWNEEIDSRIPESVPDVELEMFMLLS